MFYSIIIFYFKIDENQSSLGHAAGSNNNKVIYEDVKISISRFNETHQMCYIIFKKEGGAVLKEKSGKERKH